MTELRRVHLEDRDENDWYLNKNRQDDRPGKVDRDSRLQGVSKQD